MKKHFGVVVSGGPAPGINSAIAAIVIEAANKGYRTIGLQNGFKDISLGVDGATIELTIDGVTPLAATGGSILGTSRFNPFREQAYVERMLSTLSAQGIDKLITIGGEGSAYLSYRLGKLDPSLKVLHIPKTIDNDLILPNNYPSFGFETARVAGTSVLRTLAIDAKTTNRWFVVTTMGRKSGALALGIGIAAAATLTLVPEEFESGTATPDAIADIILGSILKRIAAGKRFGVAVLAEGILDRLDLSALKELRDCPRDELGRIRYAEVELEDVIARILRKKIAARGLELNISTKDIGYELRCHDPIAFDLEYTRFLGYGAVEYLLKDYSGGMIVKDYDSLAFVPFEQMLDQQGGIASRALNLESDLYRVARSFMIR